jgi:hypothetical protein
MPVSVILISTGAFASLFALDRTASSIYPESVNFNAFPNKFIISLPYELAGILKSREA